MKRTWVVALTLGVTATSCTLQGRGQGPRLLPATEPAAATKVTLQAAYGNLPLSFEANQGQSDAQVQFLARGHGYSLFLTPSEAVLALRQPSGTGESEKRGIGESETPISQPPAPSTQPPLVLLLQLVAANPNPQIAGLDDLPSKV